MATPINIGPIIAQKSTFIIKTTGIGQGVTLLVSGNFNGATATAGYKAADGTIVDFASADAAITADGEISITAGQNIEIFLTTTVANPTGINVLAAYF